MIRATSQTETKYCPDIRSISESGRASIRGSPAGHRRIHAHGSVSDTASAPNSAHRRHRPTPSLPSRLGNSTTASIPHAPSPRDELLRAGPGAEALLVGAAAALARGPLCS